MKCYVLIGGESRRMGRSKAGLFLADVVAAARPVFEEGIAVQRGGGAAAELVPTIFEPGHEERAALFGVLRALDHAEGRAFILAVDYPLITAAALRFISERKGRLVIPEWDRQPQMLCGVYSAELIVPIEERIEQHKFDLRGLLDEGRGEIIPEHELRAALSGEPLRNVNTPEEYERLQSSR